MSWRRGPLLPSERVPLSPLPVPLSPVPVPEHLLFLQLSGISVELTYKYILTPKIAFQIWVKEAPTAGGRKCKIWNLVYLEIIVVTTSPSSIYFR